MAAKIAGFILGPLIDRNYRLRSEGKLPDEWYWADLLAMSFGHLHEPKV